MSYIPDWFTLSEAIKHIEDAGDADAKEILRRACADGNVRSRGIVDGTSRNLGPEWWHPGVHIDIASSRITKGRTSKNVPIRALTSRQDRLRPEDFNSIPVRGNLAEAIDISSPDIDRFWPNSGAKDGEEVEKSVDSRNAKPRSQTTSPLIGVLRTRALERLAENTNADQQMADLSMWALTDAFTVEQAACLWVGVDPSANSLSRPQSERGQIAPITQMLSAAIQTGELRADSSRNMMADIGNFSKSLINAGDLRSFAEKKDQRPAFLFDTMLQSGPGPAASASGTPGPIKSKGGRPPEYDWDAFTIELFRIANHPDGLPNKQSELIKRMLQWCQDTWGREPAESGVKARVSKIYNGLGLGQKPPGI